MEPNDVVIELVSRIDSLGELIVEDWLTLVSVGRLCKSDVDRSELLSTLDMLSELEEADDTASVL